MKKAFIALTLFLILATGCGSGGATSEAASDGTIEITEKLLVSQVNDIYYNADDYLGKTIKYQGLFKSYYWEESDSYSYYVIRYGPGCCGYDGEVGFEVAWSGAAPEEDAWCEAVGELEEYEEDGMYYLRLILKSLTVLPERGAEYVSQ